MEDKIKIVIQQMIDTLNANLPEESESLIAEGWIANTLKSALADYYAEKIRKEKEGELNIVKKVAQDKEWEIQNLIVAKRKEILEL